jgi:hypothetical protein
MESPPPLEGYRRAKLAAMAGLQRLGPGYPIRVLACLSRLVAPRAEAPGQISGLGQGPTLRGSRGMSALPLENGHRLRATGEDSNR